jgi:hypothetical protein
MKTIIKILSVFVIVMTLVLLRTGIEANDPAPTPPPGEQPNQPSAPEKPNPATQDAQRITQLIQQLGADDFQTREDAQKQLEAIGEPVEPFLKAAQETSDPEIRHRTGYLLSFIAVKKRVKFSDGFLKAFPNLYHDLVLAPFDLFQQIIAKDKAGRYQYQDQITRQDLAGIIGELLRDGGPALTPDQKQMILNECRPRPWSNQGIPEALPYLRPLLKDKDAEVRRVAVWILINLGDKESISEIRKLLEDEDAGVRTSTVGALEYFETLKAKPKLIKLLSDTDAQVRADAIVDLGNLGVRETIPQIIKFLSDADAKVRAAAANALGRLTAHEAVPQITKLLSDGNAEVRQFAVYALGELGAKEAIPEITKLLSDSDENVRKAAQETLRQLEDE